MFAIGIMTTAVSIYRQCTLNGMDFADMTYSDLFVTLFSALEPPVAISLTCVPYLRTILGGRWAAIHSKTGYTHDSGAGFSKSGNRLAGSQPLESRDYDSEVRLRPMGASHVESGRRGGGDLEKKGEMHVETRWEVRNG